MYIYQLFSHNAFVFAYSYYCLCPAQLLMHNAFRIMLIDVIHSRIMPLSSHVLSDLGVVVVVFIYVVYIV